MSNASTNKEKIKLCLKHIENIVGYGSYKKWTHRNFESLSELIEQKTGVLLSVSTLKRIWNSNYKSNPQKATLDTLAQFLDYKDWFDFVSASTKKGRHLKSKNKIILALLVVAVVIFGIFYLPKILNPKSSLNNSDENLLKEIKKDNLTPVKEADSAQLKLLKENINENK